MMEFPIKQSWIDYARAKETKKQFNSTTILDHGAGQFVGILGEIVFGIFLRDAAKIKFQHCGFDSYDFDFIAGGKKIDVKTKACNTPPLTCYTVHVTESQRDRDCDIYVFCRASPTTVYLLGWISKAEFWSSESGIDSKKGQTDSEGFTERADARKLKIADLGEMSRLAEALDTGMKNILKKVLQS